MDSSRKRILTTPTILGAKPAGAPRQDGLTGTVKIMRDVAPVQLKAADLRLLDEKFEFCGEKLTQVLTDNNDFLVVGVIGAQKVGKSAILNDICGFEGAGDSSGSGMEPGSSRPLGFPVGADNPAARCVHTTSAVDVRVSTDRIIAIDTPPLFSPSLLTQLFRGEGAAHSHTDTRADSLQDLLALQLAVFLLSVCHVVLVVSDGLQDLRMWRLLHTVDIILPYMPGSASAVPAGHSTSQGVEGAAVLEHQADAVFISSRVPQEECCWRHVHRTAQALESLLAGTSFTRSCSVRPHPQLLPPHDGDTTLRSGWGPPPPSHAPDFHHAQDSPGGEDADRAAMLRVQEERGGAARSGPQSSMDVNFSVLPI
ncbi:hypothetical protein CYMTET_7424, partial [Cymbomonas tetramitiformis]